MAISVKQCVVLLVAMTLIVAEMEARPAGSDLDSWTDWVRQHAATAIDYSKDKASTGWEYLKKGTKYSLTAARKGIQNLEERMHNVDIDTD